MVATCPPLAQQTQLAVFLEDLLELLGLQSEFTCLACGTGVAAIRLCCPECDNPLTAPFCTLGNHLAQLHGALEEGDEQGGPGGGGSPPWNGLEGAIFERFRARFRRFWSEWSLDDPLEELSGSQDCESDVRALQDRIYELADLLGDPHPDDLAHLSSKLIVAYLTCARSQVAPRNESKGSLVDVHE